MNVDIAERLANRRREAGYSQEGLAGKLGVSRQAVSKWERSESSPDTDNLIALAQLYGVSLDDLLYVDDSLKDDLVFEAADRAAERNATSEVPKPPCQPETASSKNDTTGDTDGAVKKKVKIGFDGIHVNDGEDYVHVSWRDGVHVKDSSDGDEVHVGWNGIHVKEGKQKQGSWVCAGDDERNTVAWNGDTVVINDETYDSWHEAFDKNKRVIINGEEFDSWHDAGEKYGYGHWGRPSSYTVNGEYFDDLKDAKAKYGDEVGKGIPVKRHYFKHSWLKFPYPLLVITTYILLGVFANEWGMGLFVFFTIPAYYMLGHAIAARRPLLFVAGFYPLACFVWFLYMGFAFGQWHPAWVVFLTIPMVEWFVHSIERARRRRKKKSVVIDVEAEVGGKEG